MNYTLILPCAQCKLRRLNATREFSAEELETVQWFKCGDLELQAGTEIVATGAESPHLWTLYAGHAFRYVLLPDGRRQILNFLFPTDFIGLQASILEAAEHSVAALTDVHLCVFEKRHLTEVFRKVPDLGYDITWITANEMSFVDLNLVAVGQFRADERIAYLLFSFFERMRGLELHDGLSCSLPLKQQHIADSLGLSLPYTNAALKRLVKDKLIALEGGRLVVLDWERFCARAVMPIRVGRCVPFI